MAESEEALQLKRRARRRLVGAIALVSFVVIILPLLLDKEPAPSGTALNVQIPRQDSGNFNTRISPPASPPAATEGKVEAPAATSGTTIAKSEMPPAKAETPVAKVDVPVVKPVTAAPAAAGVDANTVRAASSAKQGQAQQPSTPNPPARSVAGKAASPPADAKADEARAQAALNDQTWVVPLGAFTSGDNVKQLQSKLSAAGLKSYTEPLKTAKGVQTRVRAGPFASKDAADNAREQITAMGLKPGSVTKR